MVSSPFFPARAFPRHVFVVRNITTNQSQGLDTLHHEVQHLEAARAGGLGVVIGIVPSGHLTHREMSIS